MGCINKSNNSSQTSNIPRKLYIDLLLDDTFNQPEKFCDNSIKTTRTTL
jgi:hypothetical protein